MCFIRTLLFVAPNICLPAESEWDPSGVLDSISLLWWWLLVIVVVVTAAFDSGGSATGSLVALYLFVSVSETVLATFSDKVALLTLRSEDDAQSQGADYPHLTVHYDERFVRESWWYGTVLR